MSLWSRSFEVIQNEDTFFSLGYATLNPENIQLSVPIDFTGASAEFTARYTTDPSSTLLIQLTSGTGQITFGSATVDGINVNTINFLIPHAASEAWAVGQYYCDLLVTQSGYNLYYASGPFLVGPSVSR